MSHQNKTERLKSICEQLAITPPPPKVKLPVSVLAMMTYGVDIGLCTVCKRGRIERVVTYINVSRKGVHLVDMDLLRNRGSPKKLQKAAV